MEQSLGRIIPGPVLMMLMSMCASFAVGSSGTVLPSILSGGSESLFSAKWFLDYILGLAIDVLKIACIIKYSGIVGL